MGKELELAIKIGGKIDKSLGSAINAAQSQLNTINKSLNGAGMASRRSGNGNDQISSRQC